MIFQQFPADGRDNLKHLKKAHVCAVCVMILNQSSFERYRFEDVVEIDVQSSRWCST